MKMYEYMLLEDINYTKVSNFLKRKGYDSRGAEDVKKQLQDNPRLKELDDWKAAIQYGSTTRAIDTTFSPAKKYFGVTYNFDEAGYILPDGSLLDFSGKNQGGSSGQRGFDHRNIGHAYENRKTPMTMQEFIKLGAIRILPESGDINLYVSPTKEQIKTLHKYINWSKAAGKEAIGLDIWKNGDSNTRFEKEYNIKISPFAVIKDIEDFLK
jgi:hypothetical protein